MKPWLAAHRGSQFDARENTFEAFKVTNKFPVGRVELDVHTTMDGVLVCHHDFDIKGHKICAHSYDQLKAFDAELTTLDKALSVIDPSISLILEVKPANLTASRVANYLFTHQNWWAASYMPQALKDLAKCGIDKKQLFVLQHKHPFGQIKFAIEEGYGGVALNKYYLLPPIYWYAKRKNLKIYTYTVNSLSLARIIRKLFPDVVICTDRVDKLSKLN